jgi:hypothetical protein
VSRAFVLGNGTSRRTIKLDNLKEHATVYGCNAIYREFTPDYLIAVDTKMILEISRHNAQNQNNVWTNKNKAYNAIQNLNYFNPSKGWSSGPTALWKASQDGHDEIYILGFDYKGIGDNHNTVNNVYAGTLNYKRKDERATFFGNWLKQTIITMQNNPKKRYIRVIDENGFIPKELSNIEHLSHITVQDFKEKFDFS